MTFRSRAAVCLLSCVSGFGCAVFDGGGSDEPVAVAPDSSRTIFENQQATTPPASPPVRVGTINVFGETDGQANQPASPGPIGGAFEQVTFGSEGFDSDVSISPDGKWIVFASTRHNERAEIYLQRVGGSSVVQLTSDDADDASPVFSPDGKWIAFASTRSGSWDLYLMDLGGRNVTQLTDTPNFNEIHPTFSPAGDRLAYCLSGSRSGQWEIWTMELGSSSRRMIGYGLFPAWSPRTDRDVIAFQRARQRGGRWFSLWTCQLNDGEPSAMTEIAVSSNAAVVSPAWSRDGQHIAFATIVDPPSHEAGRATQQDVWVINADGSGRRRVTDGVGVNASPAFSPDGRVFFVSDRGGSESIWSAPPAGGSGVMHAGTEQTSQENGDPFANGND